jgi:2-methylisocitrate lyase-like PEP mutase family enzyme
MISEQEQLGRSETLLANDGYFSEANVIASTTNFLIIARTDSCRFFGVEEAAKRVNAAAKVGADMGLIFPRDPDEATRAPKLTQVPLIYVQSLGNRDGRPTFSRQELQTMGYAGCIEAQFAMLYAFTAMRKALQALTPSRWSSSETHRRWPRTCRPMRRRPNIRSA